MTSRTLAIWAVVCFSAGAAVGILAYRGLTTASVVIVKQPGNVTTVLVDRPVIQPRDVVRFVTDKAGTTQLLMEQAWLENKVAMLTETVATLTASGAGQIVTVEREMPGEPRIVREATFKDWRLSFTAAGDQASYTLSQRFEALAVTAKDKQGAPTATVRLFEIGPGETRTPLAHISTTVVAATPDAPRWHMRASVTAGAGYAGGMAGVSPGGVLGLRWLSYGSSPAAEDGRWSIATPAVWLDGKGQQAGLLPVSVNLGRLPRQPFRDLWLSPFIGIQPVPARLGKIGVVIHATF